MQLPRDESGINKGLSIDMVALEQYIWIPDWLLAQITFAIILPVYFEGIQKYKNWKMMGQQKEKDQKDRGGEKN